MRVLRSADYRRMPWKNGGGETREVAVSPPGATLDTLDWRLSLATVASDGPFSVFAGVVRTLCVLEGAGISLDVAGSGKQVLLCSSAPDTFNGEAATNALLVDGPIVDLNVMSRRGRFRHTVERYVGVGRHELKSSAEISIVFCVNGEASCTADSVTSQLHPGDCAILDEPQPPLRLEAAQTMDLLVIELYREFAGSGI